MDRSWRLRARAALVAAVVGALCVIAPVGAGADTTTTTSEAPTTTAPVTTTTEAPTTTAPTSTTLPATTTTRTRETTTTPESTTTPEKRSTSSGVPTWAWLVGALAVVALLVALVAAVLGARRRKLAGQAWLPSARAGYESAVLARSLLVAQPTGGDVQLAQVRAQAEDAARALDRVANDAPAEAGRAAVRSVSEGLRGVIFCLEAENLLRASPTPPTPTQLADADVARRRRGAELDAALGQLDQLTRPPAR